MRIFLISVLIVFSTSCNDKTSNANDTDNVDTSNFVTPSIARIFNEDSAYLQVLNQVNFGPRVPGTKTHKQCFDYFVKVLRPLADTLYLQYSSAVTFDKKTIPVMNVVASFNPQSSRRILLCAHWDTRPFADQDIKDKDKPILGANDGASGVGILLEIASVLKKQPVDIGVDIVLFDAEDWGDNSGKVEDSYCLGSQYWAKNPHTASYKADFGILLDMVGAPNAVFGFEGYSLAEAQTYLSMVWSSANSAGYSNYFKNFERGYVTDDHVYVMKNLKIPMIDIIDCDVNTASHFGKYWHTHNDNMDAIDKKTLKAVGQTLVNVLSAY
jgi:Zn-dependent M28 family amino/carboxypeptidase